MEIEIIISIHAPREGSDAAVHPLRAEGPDFYPRSPRGERRRSLDVPLDLLHISIHAPREGSDHAPLRGTRRWTHISIHAPREGSDMLLHQKFISSHYFYPRSPRGERHFDIFANASNIEFLSTLPARGATFCNRYMRWRGRFLSTLPARGATVAQEVDRPGQRFLSTLPARGATLAISGSVLMHFYFYPRSPRGERQQNPTKIQLDFAQKVQMRTSDAQNGRANFVQSV